MPKMGIINRSHIFIDDVCRYNMFRLLNSHLHLSVSLCSEGAINRLVARVCAIL